MAHSQTITSPSTGFVGAWPSPSAMSLCSTLPGIAAPVQGENSNYSHLDTAIIPSRFATLLSELPPWVDIARDFKLPATWESRMVGAMPPTLPRRAPVAHDMIHWSMPEEQLGANSVDMTRVSSFF